LQQSVAFFTILGNSYGDAPLGSSKKSKSSKRKPKKKKSQNAGNVVVKKELDDEWDANEDQFAIEGNYYSGNQRSSHVTS
jgi:hypothetical protein